MIFVQVLSKYGHDVLHIFQKISICRRTESKLAKKLQELSFSETAREGVEAELAGMKKKQEHFEKKTEEPREREEKVGGLVEELAGLKEQLHKVGQSERTQVSGSNQ